MNGSFVFRRLLAPVAVLALIVAGAVPPPQPAGAVTNASANGKAIFRTGRDLHGVAIAARPPALRPSCAACHQTDGRGGVHLPGGVVSADLRYRALVTAQKPPYTVALLQRAIAHGVDNTGHPLSPVMPRWRMSERDLHDVAAYVLTQLK